MDRTLQKRNSVLKSCFARPSPPILSLSLSLSLSLPFSRVCLPPCASHGSDIFSIDSARHTLVAPSDRFEQKMTSFSFGTNATPSNVGNSSFSSGGALSFGGTSSGGGLSFGTGGSGANTQGFGLQNNNNNNNNTMSNVAGTFGASSSMNNAGMKSNTTTNFGFGTGFGSNSSGTNFNASNNFGSMSGLGTGMNNQATGMFGAGGGAGTVSGIAAPYKSGSTRIGEMQFADLKNRFGQLQDHILNLSIKIQKADDEYKTVGNHSNQRLQFLFRQIGRLDTEITKLGTDMDTANSITERMLARSNSTREYIHAAQRVVNRRDEPPPVHTDVRLPPVFFRENLKRCEERMHMYSRKINAMQDLLRTSTVADGANNEAARTRVFGIVGAGTREGIAGMSKNKYGRYARITAADLKEIMATQADAFFEVCGQAASLHDQVDGLKDNFLRQQVNPLDRTIRPSGTYIRADRTAWGVKREREDQNPFKKMEAMRAQRERDWKCNFKLKQHLRQVRRPLCPFASRSISCSLVRHTRQRGVFDAPPTSSFGFVLSVRHTRDVALTRLFTTLARISAGQRLQRWCRKYRSLAGWKELERLECRGIVVRWHGQFDRRRWRRAHELWRIVVDRFRYGHDEFRYDFVELGHELRYERNEDSGEYGSEFRRRGRFQQLNKFDSADFRRRR